MDQHLESAIRREVLGHIPPNNVSPQERRELENMNLRELLSTFFNWRNRFVSARPRTVHFSAELRTKNRPEVNGLVERIKSGDDLSPHLSTRVAKVFTAATGSGRPGLGSRRDLDLLLNEWGIYHLHISTVDRGDGYVERGNDLLFSCFRRDEAYLLDLLDHQAWTKESLVKIAVENWPNDGLFSVLPNMTLKFPVITLEFPISDHRKELRAAAVNTPVQLPTGLVFGPGMSSAGTSSMIERQINQLWNSIALSEKSMSRSEILDVVRNALEFHPFSDR
jgi:hypothetical protein